MKVTGIWIKATVTLVLVIAAGVGVWMIVDKMDDTTFMIIVGVVLTLVVAMVIGGLLIGQHVVQAYLIRRTLAQDDLGDLRQMVIMANILASLTGRSNVNVQLPEQSEQPAGIPLLLGGLLGQQQPPPQAYQGEYRDTTIEME